jgi:hypothetical protein
MKGRDRADDRGAPRRRRPDWRGTCTACGCVVDNVVPGKDWRRADLITVRVWCPDCRAHRDYRYVTNDAEAAAR